MRGLFLRALKTVLPTAVLLGVCGYLFAVSVGRVVATDKDNGAATADALRWRLPFTMAAWGGGMVLVFELFRSLWGGKPPAPPAKARPQAVDSEQLLLQMLEQAEAAEAARQSGRVPALPDSVPSPPVSVSDQTPAPAARKEALPLPDFDFDAPPPTV